MCEFVSWIEGGGKVYFLTNEVVKARLEDYKEFNSGWRRDLCGHGAIEWFFGLEQGMRHLEVNDFSRIGDIPKVIVEAIKSGQMSLIGYPNVLFDYDYPISPLLKKANTKFGLKADKIEKEATLKIRDENIAFNKKEDELDDELSEKLAKIPLRHTKIRRNLKGKYEGEIDKLIALNRVQQFKLREEQRDKQQALFWEIFSNPDNRRKCWK